MYTAAEPCHVPKHRYRELAGAIHTSIVQCGKTDEDLDGYWIIEDHRFALRYLGDRGGRDVFLRLMDEFSAITATSNAWKSVQSIGGAAFVCYLGLWRPMPLLQTQPDLLTLTTTSDFGQPLPNTEGKWLKAILLTPKQDVFVAARSAIEWAVDPTASIQLPTPVKFPTKLLPHWEALRRLFEEMETQATGMPELKAEPVQTFKDDLILDKFFIERDGNHCGLTDLEYRLMVFLRPHAGKYVPIEDVLDQVWQDDQTDWKTVAKRASLIRKKLTAAAIKGVTIESERHGHLKLVVA